MKYCSWMLTTAVALAAMAASAVQAEVYNVFNMPAGQTSLDFVTVGDRGNVADARVMDDGSSGLGAVGYNYRMGKYDVTVGQYCQFLNAVAKTDTYGLYYSGMATDMPTIKITQTGAPGAYQYAVAGSYSAAANCPIFAVNWGSAARFCNWLQNGQPVGAQGTATTERGAYTLNGAVANGALMGVRRNPGATYFIPSENEWYKAAYYRGGGTNAGYWLYPTQSNSKPGNTLPDTGNHANFNDGYGQPGPNYTDPTNHLTPVGAFTSSPGPYGTFDQGGDIAQWNETIASATARIVRGGTWSAFDDFMGASGRTSYGPATVYDIDSLGFRVASVPEPGSLAMLAGIALTALCYGWRKWV
jgi:formylglycine-generating enzyme